MTKIVIALTLLMCFSVQVPADVIDGQFINIAYNGQQYKLFSLQRQSDELVGVLNPNQASSPEYSESDDISVVFVDLLYFVGDVRGINTQAGIRVVDTGVYFTAKGVGKLYRLINRYINMEQMYQNRQLYIEYK